MEPPRNKAKRGDKENKTSTKGKKQQQKKSTTKKKVGTPWPCTFTMHVHPLVNNTLHVCLYTVTYITERGGGLIIVLASTSLPPAPSSQTSTALVMTVPDPGEEWYVSKKRFCLCWARCIF